jgi:hypothetical protein
MRMSRIAAPLLGALAAQVLAGAEAAAQIPGLYSLPKSDFTWNWGTSLERRRGAADITMNGTEAQFRCVLTAQISPSSSMTPTDHRNIESQLATRLDFIYAASEAMNTLEYQRVLEWATLDCKAYEPEERTEEESAAREQEAREKMLRELERRRERAQRSAQ